MGPAGTPNTVLNEAGVLVGVVAAVSPAVPAWIPSFGRTDQSAEKGRPSDENTETLEMLRTLLEPLTFNDSQETICGVPCTVV